MKKQDLNYLLTDLGIYEKESIDAKDITEDEWHRKDFEGPVEIKETFPKEELLLAIATKQLQELHTMKLIMAISLVISLISIAFVIAGFFNI